LKCRRKKILASFSKIWDPGKTYSGSRIRVQGSKRLLIPDPDPQHGFLGLLVPDPLAREVPVRIRIRLRILLSSRKKRKKNFYSYYDFFLFFFLRKMM
jgi:hypothetical protein